MGLKKGCLITFEGIEASGKSTQVINLYNFLRKKKIKCIKTREPGGTPIAEKIRKIIIKDLKNNEDNLTELLLLFSARSNHFKKIKKYIDRGYVVLCDRYIDSTYAYQHYEQKQSLEFINYVQKKIDSNLKPLITFFIDVSVKNSKTRLNLRSKTKDRFDKYSEKKLSKLRNSFLKLSKKHKRIKVIDGNFSKDQVFKNLIYFLRKKNVIKNI